MKRKMAKPLIEPVLSTLAQPTAVEEIPFPIESSSVPLGLIVPFTVDAVTFCVPPGCVTVTGRLSALPSSPWSDTATVTGAVEILIREMAVLPSERFRWVPYADALMYPLPNESMIHNSDQRAFFALEEKLLGRYYADLGVTARPARLDDYLMKIVRPTLERQKRGGAVAEKFEMAYLRPLDISNPSKAQAEAAWKGQGEYKIKLCRIISSVSSPPNAGGCGWRCIYTPAPAREVISTWRG